MIDHECLTQAWRSCLERGHSVGKVPVGKPSLSSELECLSLHRTLLFGRAKSGKRSKEGERCAIAHNQLASACNWLSPHPMLAEALPPTRMNAGVSAPLYDEETASISFRSH
ncbi:MAG: hypothetical protein ACXVDN_14050 [Ktedonobacteraceae bacterium]